MILGLAFAAMAIVAGAGLALPGRAGGALALRVGVAVAVIVVAAGVYVVMGSPGLPSVPASAVPPPAAAGPDLSGMIAAVEAKVARNPKDPRGWRLLAFAYERAGRHADAAKADASAEALAPTEADFPSGRGEALTEAAGGKVTDEARAAFRRALALAPGDPRARFYLALGDFQAGRHEKAKAEWDALIASAPSDASWLPEVKALAARYEARKP